MSSLTGGSFGGTQREDRGRPAHDERRDRADRKGLPAMRIDPPAGFERRERTVEPAGIGGARLREPAFEHILPVEMRALAIGCRDRVHDRRLPRLIEAVQVRHRRVQREKAVERHRRGLAVGGQRLFAAQLGPIGIADRRDDRKPIEPAAQTQSSETAGRGPRRGRCAAPQPRRTALRNRASAGVWSERESRRASSPPLKF